MPNDANKIIECRDCKHRRQIENIVPFCNLTRRQKIKIPGGEMSENKRAVVTAEQIIDCLLAEYEYWKNADSDVSIGAIGAISNVIAFATVENHRAEWHPVKEQNK